MIKIRAVFPMCLPSEKNWEGCKFSTGRSKHMGGLFYTGQSRRTSGSFTVTCSGAKDIVKRLNKLENGGQTAIKKTVNDFMSRAPAWV